LRHRTALWSFGLGRLILSGGQTQACFAKVAPAGSFGGKCGAQRAFGLCGDFEPTPAIILCSHAEGGCFLVHPVFLACSRGKRAMAGFAKNLFPLLGSGCPGNNGWGPISGGAKRTPRGRLSNFVKNRHRRVRLSTSGHHGNVFLLGPWSKRPVHPAGTNEGFLRPSIQKKGDAGSQLKKADVSARVLMGLVGRGSHSRF